MNRLCQWVGLFLIVLVSFACNNKPEQSAEQNTNVLIISCDETFKPVIDAQLQVFKADHPDYIIRIYYKPEAECLTDLLLDSVKMVIIAKQLAPQEQNYIQDSLKIGVEQATVAYDAITAIVHPSSPDSMFTMEDIRNLIAGKANKDLIPVFDGLKATSTVRFMIDTVLKGGKLGANVTAAQGSKAVVESVSQNVKAVGFIGISWIGNKEDTAQVSFLKKVKIAYVESVDSTGAYVKPLQYHLYTGAYPMVRDLVYVLREKDEYGVGHRFANFLESQRGQLVFRRSYLAPAIIPSVFRSAETDDAIVEE
jgi:phosphate transport system substrate-binding protein